MLLGPTERGSEQVRQARGLQLAQIAEQSAGCADGWTVVPGEAEAVERCDRETAGELLAGELRVELPGLAGGAERVTVRDHRGLGGDHLGRLEAVEGLTHPIRLGLLEQELAGGEVDGGEADRSGSPRRGPDGHQVVVPPPRQPSVFEHGPGRDRLDHGALDDALGLARVLDLLADRHPMPARDQLAEVVGCRLDGHAGQRHAVAPRGESDVENPRGELSVVVEHLVEIAHPEKEDLVAMLRLDLPVLPEQGRVVRG